MKDSYTKPKEVVSPKISLSNLVPIIDRGEWEYSLALLDWDRNPRVAIRWNGGTEDGKIHPGNPQSRGLPTWFIVPDEYHVAVLQEALSGKLGGGDIDANAAKEAIQQFLEKKGATQKTPDNAELEKTIIKLINKLKQEGKI